MRWTRMAGAAAVVAALVLAGCATGANSGTGQPSPTGTGPTRAAGATVSQQVVAGVGPGLVDSSGRTLYFADQESDGTIHCVGLCVQFWVPLTLTGGATPTAGSGVTGTLATVNRPDGHVQVTYDGKPLYTFAPDTTGAATGNGVKDSFGGVNFEWHVATVGGGAPIPTGSPDDEPTYHY